MSGIIGGAGSKSGIIGTTELDYEEGTWTASFHPTSVVIDATRDLCSYIKIGGLVTVYGAIKVGSISSPSGALQVNGLPFVSRSSSEMENRSVGSISGWGYTGTLTTDLHCFQSSGYTYFYIQDQGLNDVANHCAASTEFRFTLQYPTDS